MTTAGRAVRTGPTVSPATEARLAEVLGGLSLACEMADGLAPESVLRVVVLAIEIGRRHGLSRADLHDLYYVCLLRYLGCTGFAHEETHLYGAGDDIATRRTMSLADPAQLGAALRRIGSGIGGSGPLLEGARAVARIFGDGVAFDRHARAQCETSMRFARLMRLGDRVQAALAQLCERWDGKGAPVRLAGGALDVITRLQHAAEVVVLSMAESGPEIALRQVRVRAGKHLDPDVVATIERDAKGLIAIAQTPRPFEDFLAAEPEPHVTADETRVNDVALAFAYMADLKSAFTLGHSTEVSRVAERTASGLGVGAADVLVVRRAGLLHDVGRVAIPNAIWDKPGRFSIAEWERARLHAYYTERILWQAPLLRATAGVASAAHERLDGRGYHRGLPASLASFGGRILAVADVYVALREPRPHRAAMTAEEARKTILEEARQGRLDAAVVRALLDSETGSAPRRGAWPKGLSDREVDVLRLVARGKTNKEVAVALDLSPKTVQHHVAHAYGKIGVESRAAAALFATEAGLLAPD